MVCAEFPGSKNMIWFHPAVTASRGQGSTIYVRAGSFEGNKDLFNLLLCYFSNFP